MKTISLILILAIACVSTPFAFAKTSKGQTYGVSMMVAKGDDSKEYNARLTFNETSFTIVTKKDNITKEMKFADVRAADYSYSKKPMWKTGVATAFFIGVFALPFFFMKSKSHWLTVRTDKDFVVLKLEGDNYKQILAELETRNIEVETITETDKKNKKDKDTK